MKIPLDVSGAKAKLKSAFGGGVKPKTLDGTTQQQPTRRTMSEIAKEKQKRKELLAELENANTTAQRKQEIIDGLQAQLEAAQAERDELSSKVEELTPKAKAWSQYEHKERVKLIEKFPVEKRKAVQKIADSLSIEDFREYATSLTGSTTTPVAGDKSGGKDWNAILAGPDADKEIANDPKGFNEFMDKNGK